MEEISVICRNEDETVAFAQKLSQIQSRRYLCLVRNFGNG